MAPETGHDDGEVNQRTVFIDTSFDTHLATIVSDSDTVSDLKKKIMLEHRQCFPAIGHIKIHCLKVKRRGNFYHLSDSMFIKSAFSTTSNNWFVSVDASRLEQYEDIQHFDKHDIGDQLALPWVTNSRSIDKHDNQAHGSPSLRLKNVLFVNQKVPSVDQFTSGDSCKDVSKNIGEDSKIQEKVNTVNTEINSKKRTRDVQNESLLEDVKKKRKTRRVEGNDKEINDENFIERESKSKVLSDDNNEINGSEVAIVVTSRVEDVEEETHTRKNTEESETVPDVAVVVEKNIPQEMPFGISHKDKDDEMGQKIVMENEIPSSLMSTSETHVGTFENERNDHGVTKVKNTKRLTENKIKKIRNIKKDAIESSLQDVVRSNGQESAAVDKIDKHKEDRESSLKQGPETKLPEKRKKSKKSAKNKDEKIIDEKKNQVSEKTSPDSVIVKDAEISEPTEQNKTEVREENTEQKSKKELENTMGSELNKNNAGNAKENKKKKTKKFSRRNEDESSKHQSTELELQPDKIKNKIKIIEHHHHLPEASKDADNCEIDTLKDKSHEIDFKHSFVSNNQPNKTALTDNGKDTKLSVKEKKPKKKAEEPPSKKIPEEPPSKKIPEVSNDVVKDPKKTRNIDANKSAPIVKSLLNKPGTIFGDDSDESSADDNATVNSDSSTRRTPSKKLSGESESASSIDSRRNGSRDMERKEATGKNNINSQSKSKNISMADLLRSSSRFKKAKLTASQGGDTESQPVDFVPDSQPMTKR